MYSERPQGRAMTVREAYSGGREEADAGAAAVAGRRSWSAGSGPAPGGYDPSIGDPGGWGRPSPAGVGSWCAHDPNPRHHPDPDVHVL